MPDARNLGWIRDTPDRRDIPYTPPAALAAAPLPPAVDLRNICGPVYEQGTLGSCTSNSIAGMMQLLHIREGIEAYNASRLFIYYEERRSMGTLASDSGAMLRDGMKVVANLGAPPEKAWPYVVTKFAEKPPQAAYAKAAGHRVSGYRRLDNGTMAPLMACLASRHPFVFGFICYPSLLSDEVAATGILPMPGPGEPPAGGHAVLAVGYDAREQTLLCRNSWGIAWGQGGYFRMPFAYAANKQFADDFWTAASST